MDFNSLKDQVSNLTLYDLKAGVRKVQNAVMNYTDMEAKYANTASSIRQDANQIRASQTLNEIMPMIYRRFTEKSAEEWRQIYKSLQLLEFLIKHGSERVIDDARGHITLLKMLRQFHYIDQNGKDQGINVRNRAKELAELLGDVDRIRAERKKARANKTKYTGVEGGSMGGFSSSSRYGGFGSESGGFGGSSAGYGGYSGAIYGDGGGFGGQSDDWRDTSGSRADKFEEYDEFDEGSTPSSSSRTKRPERTERIGVKKTTPAESPKKKEPEVDLFSFDDPEPVPATAVTAAAPAPANSSDLTSLSTTNNDDDDFDDFQSATPVPSNNNSIPPPMVTSSAQSTAQFAAPKPLSAPQQANLNNMMSSLSPPASSSTTPASNYSSFNLPPAIGASAQGPKPATGYQAATPNYYQSVQVGQQSGSTMPAMPSASTSSGMSAYNKPAAPATAKPTTSGDPFANLWGQAGGGVKKSSTPASGPKMGQLAKEKTSASLWGAPAAGIPRPVGGSQPGGGSANTMSGSGGLDDLLG
ncbi:Epsin-3, clathrin recruitment and traffic between the Golgi and endosome [Parahypoxylon ruwenzoriense]